MPDGSRGGSTFPDPPQRVGHYEILGELGRGGMGVVYRARDLRLDREVALKRPNMEYSTRPESYKRFRREARAAAKLSHPNIIPIYEVLEQDGVPWIAMELVEGETLRHRIASGPLPLETILQHGEELASALQAAHTGHVLHRDINPNNVLIGRDGRALLMDFGLARFYVPPDELSEASTCSDDQTRTGEIRGTPGYMSPEQALGRPVDRRTDVFSLGTVVYEMCTGRKAFTGSGHGDVIDALLHHEAEAIARLNYEVPEELERIVRKMLAKSPDERYQDTRDLLVDIRTLRRRVSTTADIPVQSLPEPPRPWWRRTPWLPAAGVLVVLAVLAIGLILRSGAPPGPAGARAVLAVLPFEDQTGDPDGDLRAAMVADLLATRLADSSQLRSLGSRRTREVLGSAPALASVSDTLAMVRGAAVVDWLILGSLYRDQETYIATADLFGSESDEPVGSFRVEAASSAALVNLAVPRVRELLLPAEADEPEVGAEPAASEEARLAEFEARTLFQRSEYIRAVAAAERAVELAPGFVAAQGTLAHARFLAGYVTRARDVIDRAFRMMESRQGVATLRQSQELRAIRARIQGDFETEAAERGVLAERYPDEPETLLDWSEALERHGKLDEALPAVDRALGLDGQNPRAHLRRAQVLTRKERWDEARTEIERAEELYERLSLDGGLGEVAMTLGYLEFRQQNHAEAATAYGAAAQAFFAAGMNLRAAGAEKALGDVEWSRGSYAAARVRFDAALEIARAARYQRLVVTTLASLGAAQLNQGYQEEAERTLEEAVLEGRSLGNPRLLLAPLVNLASALIYSGRPLEGRSYAEEALILARERGDGRREVMVLSLLADVKWQQGELVSALASYETLVDLAEASGSQASLSESLASLANVSSLTGDLERALGLYDRVVEMEREMGREMHLGYALCDRGRVRGLVGLPGSENDLEEAERIARELELEDLIPRIPLVRGLLWMASGDWARAGGSVDQVLAPGPASEGISLRVPALLVAAEVALRRGEAGRGIELARSALAHPVGLAQERTAARAILARGLLANGDPAAAGEADRALEQAMSMGLDLDVARAAEVLVALDAAGSEGLREQARMALMAYLEGVPATQRDWVRSRADLRDLFEEFGETPAGAGDNAGGAD